MDEQVPRRGRPLDPAVGDAALSATLALLDQHGYADLRVKDVAERANIGLGALYRRWSTKRELVVAALRAAAAERDVPPSDDPLDDLAAGLEVIGDALCERAAPLLAVLLAEGESELAAAIREAKVEPLRHANRERLRRVIGDVGDLQTRADIGPALVVLHLMASGRPPDSAEIRERIIPLMCGVQQSG